jgi:tetratricopeptide (TPR) repeat protein
MKSRSESRSIVIAKNLEFNIACDITKENYDDMVILYNSSDSNHMVMSENQALTIIQNKLGSPAQNNLGSAEYYHLKNSAYCKKTIWNYLVGNIFHEDLDSPNDFESCVSLELMSTNPFILIPSGSIVELVDIDGLTTDPIKGTAFDHILPFPVIKFIIANLPKRQISNYQEFSQAVDAKDWSRVKSFLISNPPASKDNIECCQVYGDALTKAADADETEIIGLLIEKGAYIDNIYFYSRGKHVGYSAFHFLISHKNPLLEPLLKKNFEYRKLISDGTPLLKLAFEVGNHEAVALLLQYGFAPDYTEFTAAVHAKKWDSVKSFLASIRGVPSSNTEKENDIYDQAFVNSIISNDALINAAEAGDINAMILELAKVYKDLGNTCLNKQNYNEAINNYVLALKLNPKLKNDYLIAINFSVACSEIVDFSPIKSDILKQIIYLFERTIKNHAGFLELKNQGTLALAYQALGNHRAEEGKYEQAIAYFKQTIKYLPNFNSTKALLANAYQKLGESKLANKEYKQAISNFKHAIKYNPSPESTKELASAYLALGNSSLEESKYNHARHCYERALEVYPLIKDEIFKIYVTKGLNEESKRNPAQAICCYIHAINFKPNEFNIGTCVQACKRVFMQQLGITDIKDIKEALLKSIVQYLPREKQLPLLKLSLNPNTALGKQFWEQRYALSKCSEEAGTLLTIKQQLQDISPSLNTAVWFLQIGPQLNKLGINSDLFWIITFFLLNKPITEAKKDFYQTYTHHVNNMNESSSNSSIFSIFGKFNAEKYIERKNILLSKKEIEILDRNFQPKK